jgi:hypothetical protein
VKDLAFVSLTLYVLRYAIRVLDDALQVVEHALRVLDHWRERGTR